MAGVAGVTNIGIDDEILMKIISRNKTNTNAYGDISVTLIACYDHIFIGKTTDNKETG